MFWLDFPGGQQTMFICRNEEYAKKTARGILDHFAGKLFCDIGGNQGSRLSEPLARLMMTFVGLETSLARCT
jgi:2-polyprenyl-3-methyl-5-hydroxy-6-metoxy-1,4-benzoquinol methylase